MKNYENYLKKIDAVRASKNQNTDSSDLFKIREKYRLLHINAQTKEERDAIHADFIKSESIYNDAKRENKIKDLIIKVMENNAKIILAREILPIICEVLKAYEGKPYGEKTRAKITAELKTRTGCAVYLNSKSLYISPLDKNGYCHGTRDAFYIYTNGSIATPILLINEYNKIQVLSENDFIVHDENYIENLTEYIENLLKQYSALKAKRDAYENALRGFNNLCVGDLKTICNNDTFYSDYTDFYR